MSQSFSRRNSTGYHPSVWGDYFIEYDRHAQGSPQTQEYSSAKMKEMEELKKEQVRSLFEDATDGLLQTMNLVDSVQLLGLSYHFEKEINKALDRICTADVNNYGLYETALWFRLLRQHRHHVSPSVFNRFKDGGGSFSSALKEDIKGLLSLYNAAFLGTHDERILDEAIVFTRSHLKTSLAAGLLQEPLATQVSLVLERPLPRRTRGLFCRKYISIYEEDAARDDALLLLAKLDFNELQSLHVQELKKVSTWWNGSALLKCSTFIRDRVAECYYWMVAVLREPHYSRARVMCTKMMALITTMDDIYDNYSTLEECQLLTETIQRWEEPEAADRLPKYLKEFYIKLITSFEEFKDELLAEEKYRISYLIDEMKLMARNYYEEVKWRVEKCLPTVEEHLKISMQTMAHRTMSCAWYVGMGEMVTKEAFEWVATFPELIRTSSIVCRLSNDIHSHKLEQGRDHVASTVECYMKEHSTDAEEAYEKLQLMVEDTWKHVNREYLHPTLSLPRALIEVAVDLARSMEDVYTGIDSFTVSGTTMKDSIFLAFAQPIPIPI